jgi:hemerythrin
MRAFMTNSERFGWDDRYLVGHGAIDDTHQEFAVRLDGLLHAGDDALSEALDGLAQHAEEHFALEESLMTRHRFPASQCHADEHAHVLASLAEARGQAAAGDARLVRDLAVALADWFPGHAEVMDSALAIWISHRTAGGAPVVLRRRMRPDAAMPVA